jgi:hypothetical protein
LASDDGSLRRDIGIALAKVLEAAGKKPALSTVQ